MRRSTRTVRLVWLAAWTAAMPLATQSDGTTEVRPELARHFERYGVTGTFVLYGLGAEHWIRHDPERARSRFIPASTFKIFNSLVALETGAIENERVVIPWDAVDRGNRAWNQDQTLRTAFQRSAVWAYQELARRIGEDRMRTWVRRERYGNADIAGGIDRFWLTGALRISADEQVDLLRRLYGGDLGFSDRSMAIVRDIMIVEETPQYTIHAKTGWAGARVEGGPQIGWLVGWVVRGAAPYFFAMNLSATATDFPMREARREITYGILRELDVLPASP